MLILHQDDDLSTKWSAFNRQVTNMKALCQTDASGVLNKKWLCGLVQKN